MEKIHPETTIGHVHLKVSDLERSLKFYRDILGFEVTTWYGDQAVFLSAGGYHHHIGLNTWHSKNGAPSPKESTGLYHVAILLPSRLELAKVVKRLQDVHYPIREAQDHGVSEAVYLQDPDGNGIELYCDRPEQEWPRDKQGIVQFPTKNFDVNILLKELEGSK